MNKIYNYETKKSIGYPFGCSTSYELSITERFFEILSHIINAIYCFATDEAVVLISKLTIIITSFLGIFVMMGMSVCGIMSFFPAFTIALGLLAVVLLIFKSIFN